MEECVAAKTKLLKFVQGSSLRVVLKLVNKATLLPYPLTDATAVVVRMPSKADVTVPVDFTGAVQSADLGEISFDVDSTKSLLVNDSDDKQDFELHFDDDGEPVIVKFKEKLLVEAAQFPNP